MFIYFVQFVPSMNYSYRNSFNHSQPFQTANFTAMFNLTGAETDKLRASKPGFQLITDAPAAAATSEGDNYGQMNQSALIDQYLGRKEGGFFVEAGAWDGEYLSNTKFFERARGWTGLLVEPNRRAFRSLVTRGGRRNATAANVCLAVHKWAESMAFDSADVFGGVIGMTWYFQTMQLAQLRLVIF